MSDQVSLGILAVLLGVAVGFVLFVPFVAVSYRRRGGLFVLASAILFFTTSAGRGIPGILSGMRLADARDEIALR